MVKSKVVEAMRFLEQSLKEEGLNDLRIILFGSQFKETATKDSDIDILILSKDFRGKDIFERALLTKNSEIRTIKKFLIPLDIITMTPEEFKRGNSPITEFAKDGKVITA